MEAIFKRDWYRYKKREFKIINYFELFFSKTMMYLYAGRKSVLDNTSSRIWKIIKTYYGRKMCNEIEFKNIQQGLVLMHPYGITVNPKAILGKDITLFKGCTIGSVRSGKSAGTPIIGDRVTICVNATVVGGISVGDDVLIAAGAFVDFNVPNNSVVIGNPGVIHHKIDASYDYI